MVWARSVEKLNAVGNNVCFLQKIKEINDMFIFSNICDINTG